MSIQAVAAVLSTRMDSSRNKFVLLVLANYANDKGWAWPKQETIGMNTSLRRETINRALAELEQQGYIATKQTYRSDGSKAHKRYFLRFLYGDAGGEDSGGGEPEPDVTETHIGDVTETHSKNRHSLFTSFSSSAKKELNARARNEVPAEVTEVIATYNEHRGVLPRIVGLKSWRKPIERLLKAWPAVRDDLLADASVGSVVAGHSLADAVRLALTTVDKANYRQHGWDLSNLIAGRTGDPTPKLFSYYKKALASQARAAAPTGRPDFKPGDVLTWLDGHTRRYAAFSGFGGMNDEQVFGHLLTGYDGDELRYVDSDPRSARSLWHKVEKVERVPWTLLPDPRWGPTPLPAWLERGLQAPTD